MLYLPSNDKLLRMKLIADSGSTKTDWTAIGSDTGCADSSRKTVKFHTAGYNPNYMSSSEILDDLSASIPASLDPKNVEEVCFYGAGISDATSAVLLAALHGAFPNAIRMTVESDLLGSARALLGNSPGFAAILGTGMNSCLYDGTKIIRNVASLGFFLGDEGSAGHIGKSLLRDYLRGSIPDEVHGAVAALLGNKPNSQIIAELYSSPKPNTYCASLCEWISVTALPQENKDKNSAPAANSAAAAEYCHGLIADSFRAFFENVVSLYPDYQKYSLNCIGSVAFHCRPILEELAREYGMELGKILRPPMDGLIEYHS